MPKKQLHNLPGTCQRLARRLARRLAEGCMRVEIVMMQAPPPLPEREAEATEDELGESFFFAFERYQFVSNQDLANNTAQQKLGRVEASIAFRAAEMYKKWVPSSDRSHIPKLNKLLGTCQRQAFSLDAGYLLHDILGQALHPQREAATTEDPDAQLQGFAGRGSKVMQALAYIAAQ